MCKPALSFPRVPSVAGLFLFFLSLHIRTPLCLYRSFMCHLLIILCPQKAGLSSEPTSLTCPQLPTDRLFQKLDCFWDLVTRCLASPLYKQNISSDWKHSFVISVFLATVDTGMWYVRLQLLLQK